MRYWWVNQNQTYRQEIEGGYLWSPNGSNPQASSVLRSVVYERIQSVQFVQRFIEKVLGNELSLGTYGTASIDKL